MRSEHQLSALLRIALTNCFAISELQVHASPLQTKAHTRLGLQSTSCDAHISEASEVDSVSRRQIGEALYVVASLVNHSCAPNTTIRFDGRVLELRATKDLEVGDEIVTSYGPEAGFSTSSTRREILRRRYYFECACSACVSETADACGKLAALRVNPAEQRLKAQALDDRAREASERGLWAQAAQLTERALAILRSIFPDGSTQIAHEEAKLAQLLFNGGDPRAVAALQKAARALSLCYGPRSPLVLDLQELGTACRQQH